ncbi:MAG: hypothetical protein ACJ77K_08045 [Bacteroidia bacterium]
MAKIVFLEKPFELRAYSKKELMILLEVSERVLNRWLGALQPELGKQLAKLYSPRQVRMIIEAYGVPGQVVEIGREPEPELKKAA